jgi:aminoglycoside 6'-N-acetyltransferase I
MYPDAADEHERLVDAFLAERRSGEPTLAAVFVSTRADGRLSGFLEMSVRDYAEGCTGPTPHVESWYVDPDARRSGVGHALLRAAEEWAREHGYRELASDTELENGTSERATQGVRLRRGRAGDPLPESTVSAGLRRGRTVSYPVVRFTRPCRRR